MASISDSGVVIVTGAGGHIGGEVCRLLRVAETKFLPVDVDPGTTKDLIRCDLTDKDHVSRLLQSDPVRAVIHLAAILPSAFYSNPLAGVDVQSARHLIEICYLPASVEKANDQTRSSTGIMHVHRPIQATDGRRCPGQTGRSQQIGSIVGKGTSMELPPEPQ
jgi:hypothetical protein